jgi:hypothetical protein
MSIDTTFKPLGPTTLLGLSAVQLTASGNSSAAPISIRVRNLLTVAAYFSWAGNSGVSCVIPTAGNPSQGTIGMLPTSVETFEVPYNSWFIANTAAAFEMTPGMGQ